MNEVVDYINQWYNLIYDSKSGTIISKYFDMIKEYNLPIINPDKFILDTITEISISLNRIKHFHYNEEYRLHKHLLCDYLANKTNNYHVYADCTSSNKYYIGNKYHHNHMIVPDGEISYAFFKYYYYHMQLYHIQLI